jgi:hypothetical protein
VRIFTVGHGSLLIDHYGPKNAHRAMCRIAATAFSILHFTERLVPSGFFLKKKATLYDTNDVNK